MSTAIDQVLDLIGNMTVLELSELKKKYEEKFGVTAAAPMMAMPMGPAGGGARDTRSGRGAQWARARRAGRQRPTRRTP